MTIRDDFNDRTKDLLARRVSLRCSNPACQRSTSGPQSDPVRTVNIGVAAHITAASVGGPRYDPTLLPEQRRSAGNGIWLCQVCAKMVDDDEQRFTVDLLRRWKAEAEDSARRDLEHRIPPEGATAVIDPLETFLALLDEPENWVKVQGDRYVRHRFQTQFVIKEGKTVIEDFREPWTQRFPDSYARSFEVEYWHGPTLLKLSIFVTTDGGRYSVPLPQVHNRIPEQEDKSGIEFSLSTSSLEWKTALLFNQYDDLWTALPRAGVKLVP